MEGARNHEGHEAKKITSEAAPQTREHGGSGSASLVTASRPRFAGRAILAGKNSTHYHDFGAVMSTLGRDTAEKEGRRASSKAAGIGGCYRVLVCGNCYQQWWASQPAVSRLLELAPGANRPWAPARADTQQRQLSSRAPPNGQHQLAYPAAVKHLGGFSSRRWRRLCWFWDRFWNREAHVIAATLQRLTGAPGAARVVSHRGGEGGSHRWVSGVRCGADEKALADATVRDQLIGPWFDGMGDRGRALMSAVAFPIAAETRPRCARTMPALSSTRISKRLRAPKRRRNVQCL